MSLPQSCRAFLLAPAFAVSIVACSPGPDRPGGVSDPATPTFDQTLISRDILGPYQLAAEAGQLVFLSDILAPPGEDGSLLGDVESQAGAALRVLGEVLQSEGLGYEHLVHVRVLVVAQDGRIDTDGLTRAWQRTFANRLQPAVPARSIAGISALPRDGALVAVEAVAMRPDRAPDERPD